MATSLEAKTIYEALFNINFKDLIDIAYLELYGIELNGTYTIDYNDDSYIKFQEECNMFKDNWQIGLINTILKQGELNQYISEFAAGTDGGKLRIRHRKPSKNIIKNLKNQKNIKNLKNTKNLKNLEEREDKYFNLFS